ncbi:hypothetical protein B0H16DRAFT_479862 [Mycena metata]|uniref:Uncharacterized protein n=1 Tax=Mycena metata TaxID=1033252 RepID=A0AAD7KEP4_9AGAR|nr:hypothetical protein B0H16DRAFT_479862 [Mycena metata]
MAKTRLAYALLGLRRGLAAKDVTDNVGYGRGPCETSQSFLGNVCSTKGAQLNNNLGSFPTLVQPTSNSNQAKFSRDNTYPESTVGFDNNLQKRFPPVRPESRNDLTIDWKPPFNILLPQ